MSQLALFGKGNIRLFKVFLEETLFNIFNLQYLFLVKQKLQWMKKIFGCLTVLAKICPNQTAASVSSTHIRGGWDFDWKVLKIIIYLFLQWPPSLFIQIEQVKSFCTSWTVFVYSAKEIFPLKSVQQDRVCFLNCGSVSVCSTPTKLRHKNKWIKWTTTSKQQLWVDKIVTLPPSHFLNKKDILMYTSADCSCFYIWALNSLQQPETNGAKNELWEVLI